MNKRLRLATALIIMMTGAACGSRLSSSTIAARDRIDDGRAANGVGAGSSGEAAGTSGDTGAALGAGPSAGASGGGGPAGGPADAAGAAGAANTSEAKAAAAQVQACPNGGATDAGVTAKQVKTGWVGTISGPVPGLFEGAARGVNAYYAMVNASGGVNGRQLVSDNKDDSFQTAQNRAAAESLAPNVLSFVGAYSTADAGLNGVAEARKVPDVGQAVDQARQKSGNNYSPLPQPDPAVGNTGEVEWLKRNFPGRVTKAAVFWTAVASAQAYGQQFMAQFEHAGVPVVFSEGLSPTAPDFTGEVLQMKQRGVDVVNIVPVDPGTIPRMVKAMNAQNFHPVTNVGPVAYTKAFLEQTGAASEGAIFDIQWVPFEESGATPGSKAFATWLGRLYPTAQLDTFTVLGWVSAQYFVQALRAAGPCVTRDKLRAELGEVTQFNGDGLIPNQNPSQKVPSCGWVQIQIHAGRFQRLAPNQGFFCTDSIGKQFRY